MFKTLLLLGLLSTASALKGMRAREETGDFLDMFDAAVEDKEVAVVAPEALIEQDFDGDALAYNYYDPNSAQSGGTSPYYYGGGTEDTDPSRSLDPDHYPGIKDRHWQRPWNIVNGACSETNIGKKHAMEITSVGGGSYYLGVIDIGTPAQPLNMILDTGSDEIVIKGKGCKGCKGYGYDMHKSSTGVKDEQGPNAGLSAFAYGSGPVVAQRVNDTVHLGDFKGDKLGIQVITDTTISFFQQNDKGALHAIVGMAPGMKEYVGNTLASTMEVRTFSECLPKNPEENGFFIVNDDRAQQKEQQGFNGPFRGVGQYYWAAALTGLRMEWEHPVKKYKDTENVPLYDANRKIVAIVDTGTSLLSMPQTVMEGLRQALEELNFDCARMKELPSLKFEIEGVTHMLAPEDYVAISDGGMSALYNTGNNGINDVAASLEAKKLFFHKPGKPEFKDKETGQECMLLFTDPLGQTSSEGEMAILGMPFFREYEISFDFCTKEMFTKRSKGDCHNIVGQRPSNVQYCTDKDWLGCWFQGFIDFFKGFWDGLVRILGPTRGGGVDGNDKVQQKQHKLFIKPETLRLSSAAHWLLQTNGDGMIDI